MNTARLRQLRKDRKLSLQSMAVSVGLTTAGGYKRIESGEHKLKADHIPLIANRFNMDIRELVEEIFFVCELDETSTIESIKKKGENP